jgi:phage-related protein
MDPSWKVTFFDARVEREVLDLPVGLLARFLRYAERLEAFGPDLGMPHTKPMGRGLFELRLRAAEGIGRVLYCAVSGRRIVMLHQFVKKTQKTPAREIQIARSRMKDLPNV